MKASKYIALLLSAALALPLSTQAQDKAPGSAAAQATALADMANGEIRKVDKASKKITIRHGEIKNLEMPGMTMVFRVKDDSMLDQVNTGDKVKFIAERLGGAIVVTSLQLDK